MKRINELPVIKNVLQWSKTHSFPGFFGVPIYDVLHFSWAELQRDSLTTRANSAAFSFFLSIFPSILFIFTITPYLLPYFDFIILPNLEPGQVVYDPVSGSVDFNKTIIKLINDLISSVNILPLNVQDWLIRFLQSLATQTQAGKVAFVLILAIFFASNGVLTLMRGFEKSHQSAFISRSVFNKRWIAIQLTFLIFLLSLASVVLIVLGNRLLDWLAASLRTDAIAILGLQLLRWLVVIGLFYFIISLIYRLGVPSRRKWRLFSTGATAATLLSILSTVVFTIFVNRFGAYNELYGSLGTIMVVMLWIQLNAAVLLIGFELNASITVNRDLRKRDNPED